MAIKVILPHYANQPDFIRRFEGEAQLITRLEHPHIVPLYDYWREPEGAYLVMRWLRGGNLKEMLEQKALDLTTTGNILNQVCSALATAHQHGVIHRDIKPSNVLIDEYGNAYLGDFGIAKNLNISGQHTNPDAIIGSPGYLAPEQARGETVTPRTDVYSLGVMLFEMLAGQHPFAQANEIERMYKHMNELLPYLDNLDPNVTAAINDVIQNATAKNPVERYATAIEFVQAYREAAQIGEQTAQGIVESLTRREQEILQLIIDNKSNKEIAHALYITVGTVRWHIRQIYKKLNVRSRVQAIVKARELNLIVAESNGRASTIDDVQIYVVLPEPDNPYKGLKAFTAADSRDFFGRENLIQKLLAKMQVDEPYRRFLAVVGPSGSGKSSLVQAGLIPAIWQGQLPQSDNWYVVDMIPGAHPLDELEVALTRVAADQSTNLMEHLKRDERGLVRVGQLILPEDDSELLLVIDQFEEVFTLVEDEAQRSTFLNLLYTAVSDPRSRIRVVVTLRADFFDRPLQYPNFGEVLRNRMETILPLTAEELERSIVKPAYQVGVKFEDGLVSAIVGDINYQPGALPLLQYALTELFDRRAERIITRIAYQAIGGTIGALAKRADAIYDELSAEGQAIARQIFMRLVTLGEGTEDTRRRVTRQELQVLAPDNELVDEIIDTFAEYRLLSLDHDPVTRLPTVEVAHEAILREWERLHTWLNDSREDIKSQRLLATAAQAWTANNQDNSYLLRGKRLAEFEAWVAQTELSLTPSEQEFIQMSLSENQRAEDVETERQVQKERLEQRAKTRLQNLVAVFVVATFIAVVLAIFAFGEQTKATNERDKAKLAEHDALEKFAISLSAQAEDVFEAGDQELGILLALASVEEFPETWQARSSLWKLATNYSLNWNYFQRLDQGTLEDIQWSPNGQYMAISTHTSVAILDIHNPIEPIFTDVRPNVSDRDSRSKISWTPDSQYLISMIDLPNPDSEDTNDVSVIHIYGLYGGSVREVVAEVEMNDMKLSPSGDILAFVADNGGLYLWEFQQNDQFIEFASYSVALTSIDWSLDGQYLLTGAKDNNVQIWNINTNEMQTISTGHAGEITDVAWSPDQALLTTGSEDQTVRIWRNSSDTYDLVTNLGGYEDAVEDIEWQYDGQLLAVSSNDGGVRLLDTETWNLHEEFFLSAWVTKPIDFSPDGQNIAMTHPAQLLVHNINIGQFIFHNQELGQYAAQWSPNGRDVISAGGAGNTLILTDTSTGEIIWQLESKSGAGINWSPDGSQILETPFEPLAYIRDADTGDILMSIPFPEEEQWANFAAWSPDGEYVVLGTNGSVHLVDAYSGEIVKSISKTCWGSFPSWSPDSQHVVVGCAVLAPNQKNDGVQIWNVETGEIEYVFWGHNDSLFATAWSPDGSVIVTSGVAGTVIAWDAKTGEIIQEFGGHDQTKLASGVAWSPDGKYFASTGVDRNIFIWELGNPSPILQIEADAEVWVPAWSPDGQYLMVSHLGTHSKPSVYRIFTSTDEIIQQAYNCCITRELTDSERATFGLPPRNN